MHWTEEEKQLMRDNYFFIGPDGMKELLPERKRGAIVSKAHVLGLKMNSSLRQDTIQAGVLKAVGERRRTQNTLTRVAMEETLSEVEKLALYGRRV